MKPIFYVINSKIMDSRYEQRAVVLRQILINKGGVRRACVNKGCQGCGCELL